MVKKMALPGRDVASTGNTAQQRRPTSAGGHLHSCCCPEVANAAPANSSQSPGAWREGGVALEGSFDDA